MTNLQRIKRDYTGIHHRSRGNYHVWFQVEQQSFSVGIFSSREEAVWMRNQLTRALEKMVEQIEEKERR